MSRRRPFPTRLQKAMLVLAAFLLAAISAVQARPYQRYDPRSGAVRDLTFRNLRQGMKLFRGFCRKCHNQETRGEVFLSPDSRTTTAWNQVFAERYVACAEEGIWHDLPEEQLWMINDYLYHEADNARAPHTTWDWKPWGLYGW